MTACWLRLTCKLVQTVADKFKEVKTGALATNEATKSAISPSFAPALLEISRASNDALSASAVRKVLRASTCAYGSLI